MTTPPVEASRYDGAAAGWAAGAALVYGPLARELVAFAPHGLAGRQVLDVGAGTGVGSDALSAVGARPIALDLSWDMLRWRSHDRPPAAVARADETPVRDASVDDVFASFVLNHLRRPVAAMVELARAVRPGGAFLATTYSNESRSAVRDRVDEVAAAHGWVAPAWYRDLKANVTPLLGSASAMAEAARAAGLADVVVDERPVDVGVHRPDELVRYRFGQAQFAEFVGALGPREVADLRGDAFDAIEPIMEPYRPVVVFLAAVVRTPRSHRAGLGEVPAPSGVVG